MTINKKRNGNTLNVSIEGRLDTGTTPEAEKELKGCLDDITELNLDFSHLDYISSAGLRLLLSLQKTMNTRGSMKIQHPNDVVKEIFEVTGFSDILTVE
ncbi:MAG: STAS domain-containing protein [Ruminococcus sp.]|jgi:anti-sigma B factor antagonist|uniref:STAS domain-containing protein n=1 Tax=Ruminococcus sp. TaxID=41978 RepID=UPI00292DEA4F|nr:STAS domain-containing protein [uncultured Ruminococcus sp.]MBQ6412044.1 STAS domain-containing protein [Ruminococcus sp.]